MEKELLYLTDAARAAASIVRTNAFRDAVVSFKADGCGPVEHTNYHTMKDGFESIKIRKPFKDENLDVATGCVYFSHGDAELILKIDGKVSIDKEKKTIMSPDMIVENLIDDLIYSKSGQFCLQQMITLVDRVEYLKSYREYDYRPFNVSEISMEEYVYINKIHPSDAYEHINNPMREDVENISRVKEALEFFLNPRSERVIDDYSMSNINRRVLIRKPMLDERITTGEGVRTIISNNTDCYGRKQYIYIRPAYTGWYTKRRDWVDIMREVINTHDNDELISIVSAYEEILEWYNEEYSSSIENMNHHICW